MSQRLIARSPDLKRLQNEGYDIHTCGAVVIIKGVPYLTSKGEVQYGALVATLDLANDVTVKPQSHVAFFAGEKPYDANGKVIPYVISDNINESYGGVGVKIQLSARPKTPDQRYNDYYHKMSTYLWILSAPARRISPSVSAKTHPVVVEDEEETVFNYVDSASSRAGIEPLTDKLKVKSVAIVGLGGTGAYVLDLLAKTPIGQIHLFDGDTFYQHNAFRAPGAPTAAQLGQKVKKVKRFSDLYSAMRRGIIEHDYNIDEATVYQLREMDFVFIAIDNGQARKLIVTKLEEFGVAFIDVGIGVKERNCALHGMVRTTTSTPTHRSKGKIPFTGGDEEDDYTRNIQIADLNSLNAALAVIKWKKLIGFYGDIEREHQSVYTINGNYVVNADAI